MIISSNSFSGPRSSTNLFSHFISHKKKPSGDSVTDSSSSSVAAVHLPTSLANPNVKFDLFHTDNPGNDYLHGSHEDTEEDEEDEEDELATTDLLKKTKHQDYLAKKLNLASGSGSGASSFNQSTSSLASSSAGNTYIA